MALVERSIKRLLHQHGVGCERRDNADQLDGAAWLPGVNCAQGNMIASSTGAPLASAPSRMRRARRRF